MNKSKIEDLNIEYKSDIPKRPNDLKAEIVAFLNTEGGTIILGADNDGNILSEKKEKYKEWEEKISNWIFNAFYPDVSNLIFINIDDCFEIVIKKGIEKPYFYKDGNGFNAKGVFVRVGSSKRVASFEEIQRMIFMNKAKEYETLSCDEKNLTFSYLKKKLKESNIRFDIKGLSLINKNGKYNNAALLLSDQNPTVSKFAIFQGKDVSVFLDKKEFTGSIMKQLDNMIDYANIINKKKVIISGKTKHDEYRDYPERALREAICNCYCHRDWTMSGDIKIEFYDDRVEIFSQGSLPNGLTLKNIQEGITAKRNPIVVNALNKADLIENYASGVRRIFADYEYFEKQPLFNISDNAVIVTLYNMNYDSQKAENDSQKTENGSQKAENDSQKTENDSQKAGNYSQKSKNDSQKTENDSQKSKNDSQKTGNDSQKSKNDSQKTENDSQKAGNDSQKAGNDSQKSENDSQKLKGFDRQKKIMKLMYKYPQITAKEICEKMTVSESTIRRDISYLQEKKCISYQGSSKNGNWIVLSECSDE